MQCILSILISIQLPLLSKCGFFLWIPIKAARMRAFTQSNGDRLARSTLEYNPERPDQYFSFRYGSVSDQACCISALLYFTAVHAMNELCVGQKKNY